MNNYGEVDKTDRTELGKCIHLYDVTQGNKETQALSTENCLPQVQEKYTDNNKRRRKQRRRLTGKKNLM